MCDFLRKVTEHHERQLRPLTIGVERADGPTQFGIFKRLLAIAVRVPRVPPSSTPHVRTDDAPELINFSQPNSQTNGTKMKEKHGRPDAIDTSRTIMKRRR